MRKFWILVGITLGLWAFTLSAVPISAARQAAAKAVTLAAKRSNRTLQPAARVAAEEAACKAFAKYGDDVFHVMEKGGLESLKQGERYGKDFWKICSHAPPQAVRSLALHADTLLPLAKRIGPEFLALEGKVPGLGAKCVKLFGEKSAKTLAKASPSEIKQLVGYAQKADSPQTVRLLHEAYEKSNGTILKHLSWKQIMAGGLSAGTVIAAYKLSGGVSKLAETNPSEFVRLVTQLTWPLQLGLLVLVILLCWELGRIIVRAGGYLNKKIPQGEEKSPREPSSDKEGKSEKN